MKKKKIFILGTILLIILAGSALVYRRYYLSSCYPSEEFCSDHVRQTDKASFKTDSAYFIEQSGGYECSKPIKLVSNTLNSKGEYINYRPVNTAEGNVLCHMTSAVEFKGKLKVLQRPEVIDLINKYNYQGVSIKAVEFKYIQDKEYVHRLLPEYKNKEIGCIIVLETPNEKRVYLEDESLNTFEEMDYKSFEQSLNSVNAADKQMFLDNLK